MHTLEGAHIPYIAIGETCLSDKCQQVGDHVFNVGIDVRVRAKVG